MTQTIDTDCRKIIDKNKKSDILKVIKEIYWILVKCVKQGGVNSEVN